MVGTFVAENACMGFDFIEGDIGEGAEMMIVIKETSCKTGLLRRETNSGKEIKNVLRIKDELNMRWNWRRKEKP